jgi:nitroimidazol reductase NimA-like FMN-containing flavoprotein (pyridoxamine 5'-phosphate oxidase superfamily)
MDERFATEVLTESECWELLSRTLVGRLAVCLDGRPQIFPINFVPDRGSIVFRTAEGTKLSAARHQYVSFEIDGYEPEHGLAWSVIVAGPASEILDPDDWDDARDLPLFPWHVAPKGRFVRISAEEVSGRRFFAPYAGPSGLSRTAPR